MTSLAGGNRPQLMVRLSAANRSGTPINRPTADERHAGVAGRAGT
jgi:hypothetical protein